MRRMRRNGEPYKSVSGDAARRRASDPNTDPGDLWILSINFPREVLNNPVLPLIQIEDGQMWHSIMDAALNEIARRHVTGCCTHISMPQYARVLRFFMDQLRAQPDQSYLQGASNELYQAQCGRQELELGEYAAMAFTGMDGNSTDAMIALARKCSDVTGIPEPPELSFTRNGRLRREGSRRQNRGW